MEKTVQVHAHYIRCPYCHDNVETDSEDWVACQQCLARHHTECWVGQCSACQCEDHLQPGKNTSKTQDNPQAQDNVGDHEDESDAAAEDIDLSDIEPLDIMEALHDGKELFQHKNYLIFALAGTIATLLSGASLFILAGLLNAGLWMMGLRMLDEQDEDSEPLKIGDLFNGLDQFGVLTIASLVKYLIVIVGMALLFLPGVIFESLFTYVVPLIVERKFGWKDAFKKSIEIVRASGLKQHFLLVLFTTLISLPAAALSGTAAPFGALLTGFLLPLTFGPWLAAYRQVLKKRGKISVKAREKEVEAGPTGEDQVIEDGVFVKSETDSVIEL